MRLKQIKLAGFKSFVDPTTVNLPGNRCAVVGPNGCGKSNIIDAVRWVMGESSAKQLRGENLTDVIFNGSSSRKPTAVASIELVFDNSDGRIGGAYAAYAEIAIRRQVTRDSQSAYFLNGSKCRRRDIADIFLGTGFGPRSYSIIEQGMIGQLVDARPEELRVYLEEAAGISKYKERRRETTNRIKHTRENLERLQDIRDELGQQLNRLQRQAKAAQRYAVLKEEEKLRTAQLYTIRHMALSSELDALQENLRRLEVELERVQAAQRAHDLEIEKSRTRHGETSDEFNDVQGRYYQLGADIARVEEAIQFNQERVKELELDLDGVRQRNEETNRQLTMDEAQISALHDEIAELVPQLVAAELEDRTASDALVGLEEGYRQWQDDWDIFTKRAADNEREAQVQSSRIDHLMQLIQRLRTRLNQLEEESQTGVSIKSDHVHTLAEEIETHQRQQLAAEGDIDRGLTNLASAREDVLMRENVLEEARNEVHALRHDLANLQAVQRAALGRSDEAVEQWLTDNDLQGSERLGETLSVVPGWERAVESVLGEFLQSLRVDDVASYAEALADFADGHVALVEARIDSSVRGELPSLVSLVRSDDLKLGSILHGVFAAESAAVALATRTGLKPGESIITREGFWVGPDWMRKLPAVAEDAGIIQRAQEVETLNLRVEEAERTLAELQNHVVEGRERINVLEQERETLQAKVILLNKVLGELKADHGVRQVQLDEADARRDRLSRDRQDIESQIVQESAQLSDARVALGQAEHARESEVQERRQLVEAKDQMLAALDVARPAARSIHDRYHALNSTRQSLASRLEASETAHERLINQQQELSERKHALERGIEASATPLPRLQVELESKLAERLAVERQLGDVRSRLEQLDQTIREQEGQRGEAEGLVDAVRTKLETVRVERQGLNVQEANIKQQVVQTGHELDAVRCGLPEDATDAGWSEQLERIDRRIQRLGAINLAAIEEYEAQSERKTYLDAQHEDLAKALDTLSTAIRRIDKETRARFKQTFDAVNAHLGALFPKVFGGGHAYLELTGEDLLDTGVTLMARPPGKRNASVQSLSGGEKAMTAIALIFAIFQLNPSPVCLLDEVDAPLDDTNVTRFAELIQEMSADVQFVVITHNKITMETADHLMGVTMNEPGVSRLVSVDVEEAAAMAAS
ncbi:MAG: chromosome segregation protein SMC [Gammaproteobacteria bacterium]|nr:chromosome segregation protein SMC [Gammaproteobacteria bacterium]